MKIAKQYCRGQALTEYVMMVLICLLIASSLAALFHYFTIYGEDRVEWIGVDYP